ncbi:MAG: gamma-glutamyl-gamma-aminobutyrate hydrolase family protein [Chitinophagales bacterium]|nr:gamma-glutamyl-gamma-aminobutyrate hydrolase family protein [Chitinophagales bacterium]MDW8273584.1 gamma-glutamyl-gamma-aminobutyrate hydrolase family protein [Chitinophagales bacterium]
MKNTITVGITDCGKYQNYYDWISSFSPEIQIVRLSYRLNNFKEIEKCTHIMLTGGEDVHPRFYHSPELLKYCLPDDLDEKRDEFELQVLEYSQEKGLPLLGICRGLQIANVFFGGTLIPDLPSFGKFNHSKFNEGSDRYHPVTVDINSMLYTITMRDTGIINSAHHQSAAMIGKDLVVNAFSPDGVIEGIERKNPYQSSWLLLVQWHPERMRDKSYNEFAVNIRKAFLQATPLNH